MLWLVVLVLAIIGFYLNLVVLAVCNRRFHFVLVLDIILDVFLFVESFLMLVCENVQ